MAIEVITENIWEEITKTVSKHKGPSYAAVAYFGTNGSQLLPLKKGSTLLVDASLKAVKTGQTNPSELLKLYYKGVSIYSLENLHSKIYVVGSMMFIGSGNVSNNSAVNLKEIFIKTNDKKAVSDGIDFISQYCHIELGEHQLKELEKQYVPPRINNIKKAKSSINTNQNIPAFYLLKLEATHFSEEELQEFKEGRKEAKKKRIKKTRHRVDEFEWEGKLNAKVGDAILQITKEDGKESVSPVGILIHIHKARVKSKDLYFLYIEVPDVEELPINVIKKKLGKEFSTQILRAGRKTEAFGIRMLNLFKKHYATK